MRSPFNGGETRADAHCSRQADQSGGLRVEIGMPDPLSPSSDVRNLVSSANLLGEGPVWVEGEGALYWVDIQKPAIWRLQLDDHYVEHWTPPFRVTMIAPRASGGLVGAGDNGFLRLDPQANNYDVFGHPEHGVTGNRFNDGGVDRTGSFWVGSMDDAETQQTGHIYRVQGDHSWVTIDSGFHVPNGPAFSPDGQAAYLADSPKGVIYRYTLEPDGSVLAREDFIRLSPEQGFPDGMATDANGCVWVAFWDGGCIRCFNPDGAQLRQIDLPVSRPTSCAFGGPDLDQLFITSARIGLSESDLEREPEAGSLFLAQPGVHGWPLPHFTG